MNIVDEIVVAEVLIAIITALAITSATLAFRRLFIWFKQLSEEQKAMKAAAILILKDAVKDIYFDYAKDGETIPLYKKEKFYALHDSLKTLGFNGAFDDIRKEISGMRLG